jgi:hypothetical protein
MSFFKNIFGIKEKRVIEPMHGQPLGQTSAEQDATRKRMETEMAEQRERRTKHSATQR